MIFKAEVKIQKQKLELHEQLSDEYFFRKLAVKIVTDISLKELKQLMAFNKIDPQEELSKEKSQYSNELLRSLHEDRVVLYEAKCQIGW